MMCELHNCLNPTLTFRAQNWLLLHFYFQNLMQTSLVDNSNQEPCREGRKLWEM